MTVTHAHGTHAPGTLRMTPARRVALAIGVPVSLTLIGWLGFSTVADIGQASFPVSVSSIPVQHGHVSVSTGGGNITVHPGQPGAARLAGKVTYSLFRPDVTRTSDGVNLHCRFLLGNCELDATLTVPPQTSLRLSTGGGDQTVSGVRGGVNLSSDGGNVSVSGVGGDVTVSSGGGDLTADGLAGVLSFSTDGGNIGGTTLTSPDVSIHSGGGDVTLTFTQAPANVDITADGGNVTLVLPHNDSRYAVSTTSDGGNVGVQPGIINSSSNDKITIESGGGDINVAYPS
jgi:Toastrack DUF4097